MSDASGSARQSPDATATESHDVSTIESPPTTFMGTLRRLGPGLIIAGSIVGSGELIATTKTGAQAGISLLWLILVGCLIKVFLQVELGRYTVCSGQTTLAALDTIPGPRFKVKWVVWFWMLMMLASIGQLGGIVGGVGQALAIAMPIKDDYRQAIRVPSAAELRRYFTWKERLPREEQLLSQAAGEQREERARELDRVRIGLDKLDEKLHPANDPKLAARAQQAMNAVQTLMRAEAELKPLETRAQQAAGNATEEAQASNELHAAEQRLEIKAKRERVETLLEPRTFDDRFWAAIVALITIGMLYRGRYTIVQNVSTVLVVLFTFVTIGNVIALEVKPTFRLTIDDFLRGFGLPSGDKAFSTALKTFGIIGVGAAELVAYPYWCLEKGYARFTGPISADEGWVRRARGWMRVMHYDAFISMAVYTTATIAFFLMGVAVLHRYGLDPEGMRMVGTLLEQYVPVFGRFAHWMFLIGAIAVLYSTFMVANAGHARMYTDCLKVFGLMNPANHAAHHRSISIFGVILPLIALGIYCIPGVDPVTLVLIGGLMQGLMLPMLGFAGLYFRYKKTDARVRPGRAWDTFLIVSCVGMLITGLWTVKTQLFP